LSHVAIVHGDSEINFPTSFDADCDVASETTLRLSTSAANHRIGASNVPDEIGDCLITYNNQIGLNFCVTASLFNPKPEVPAVSHTAIAS
jgi:hypothetical protein